MRDDWFALVLALASLCTSVVYVFWTYHIAKSTRSQSSWIEAQAGETRSHRVQAVRPHPSVCALQILWRENPRRIVFAVVNAGPGAAVGLRVVLRGLEWEWDVVPDDATRYGPILPANTWKFTAKPGVHLSGVLVEQLARRLSLEMHCADIYGNMVEVVQYFACDPDGERVVEVPGA